MLLLLGDATTITMSKVETNGTNKINGNAAPTNGKSNVCSNGCSNGKSPTDPEVDMYVEKTFSIEYHFSCQLIARKENRAHVAQLNII